MNIGGRREPTKIGGSNKLAAGSSALTFALRLAINQIKGLGLYERQVNRTRRHEKSIFLE
jgi:hypothetical protein